VKGKQENKIWVSVDSWREKEKKRKNQRKQKPFRVCRITEPNQKKTSNDVKTVNLFVIALRAG
jgi:hypothetical protein